MAAPSNNKVMALGLGCAIALSAPAFVPSAAPAQTAAPAIRGAAAQPQGASGASAAGAATVAAASLGVASLVATRIGAKRSTRAAPVVRNAQFAGGLVGNTSALGEYNFDPLGIAEKCPQFLPWFREAELKHGRLSMLAWVGLVTPELFRIPHPESLDACYDASVIEAHNACIGGANGPLQQVLIFCAVIEMLGTFPKCVQGLTLENAGDYELGKNFLPDDPAKAEEMKLKELKNGRLAMLAYGGAITQAVLTGNGFPWLYATRTIGGAGLASSVKPAGGKLASRVAMRAEGEGGYKMSKAVPFLPASPALEGYVGEEDGFDPMGISLAFDIAWLREAELKHGRVAMLATVGWIATDLGLRVSDNPAFQVSTIEAHDAMVKFGAMPQMLVWLGYLEVFGFLAFNNAAEGRTDRKPGDFGLRWLYPKDEEGQYQMQLKELRNGRLAMLAYGGIVTAAVLTGKAWPFFAQAPERQGAAFGTGAAFCGLRQQVRGSAVATQAMERSRSLPFLPKPENLAGYVGEEAEFDPLGFSDTFDMKWLREAELKHGRVCMLATVGFMAQQWITLPGVTPQADSLKAVYTAPPAYFATLIFLAGYIESTSYGGKMTMLDMFEGGREPGYHFKFGAGFLSKDEKQAYDMKLKELNNGRLAMLAFSGMVHHNLVVKGPLFPLFPEGWTGPQGSWELDSVFGRLNTPGAASTWGA